MWEHQLTHNQHSFSNNMQQNLDDQLQQTFSNSLGCNDNKHCGHQIVSHQRHLFVDYTTIDNYDNHLLVLVSDNQATGTLLCKSNHH